MGRVRRRDTAPELAVRKVLYSIGARYRVDVSSLPGSPDIANKTRGRAIFVHGCFWHYHQDCRRGNVPKRNHTFWRKKLLANRRRDRESVAALEARGFRVLVVWECEVDAPWLREELRDFWFD